MLIILEIQLFILLYSARNLRVSITIVTNSFKSPIPKAILLACNISLGNFLLRPSFLIIIASLISNNIFSYFYDKLIILHPK